MTHYVAAHMYPAEPHAEVFAYMERVQSTLKPFGGEFLVHGVEPDVIEGEWPGALVLLGFPDEESAKSWYASEAYQEIKPLRTRHINGDVIMAKGVPEGYDAGATAARLREGA